MAARDPFRFINDLDEATVGAIITRLEFRGKDAHYVEMLDAYLDRLDLPPAAQVLTVGCGTGVEARALAKRRTFTGQVTATDHSPALLEAARGFAAAEGVAERISFRTADAHALDFADASFDAVIGHTMLSHVTDPVAVLRETTRVVKPGGMVAIFDGDYASLTFGYPDPALAEALEAALIAAIVNNPRVMRDMPRLLRQIGLDLTGSMAHVYADIGHGGFFANLAAAFAPSWCARGWSQPSRSNGGARSRSGRPLRERSSAPATTLPTSLADPTRGERPGSASPGSWTGTSKERLAARLPCRRFEIVTKSASSEMEFNVSIGEYENLSTGL
jgi:ubiquinone/menaquinone biosynthesis C-methylase UbiE